MTSNRKSVGGGRRCRAIVAAVGLALLSPLMLPAGASAVATDAEIRAAVSRAVGWLYDPEHVNDDGSWGDGDVDEMLCTAEVVRALRATNLLGPHYVGGVSWLANHRAANLDLAARRLAALTPHGDSLQAERTTMIGAKTTGLTAPGWGLTGFYRFDPLDTALVLNTLGAGDAAFLTAHLDAIESMAQSGLTIGYVNGGTADVATSIAAARALRTCAATGTTRCTQLVGSLVSLIDSNLVGYPPASSFERALITGYFTAQRDAPPIPLGSIVAQIDLLLLEQDVDGSWDGDVLTTALALRALASWLGLERADGTTVVAFSDPTLRAVVNRALGHHAMDTITRGDLWRLTSLDLAYARTTADLSALSQAVNITSVDISGNPCLLAQSGIATTLHNLFPNLTTIVSRPLGDLSLDGVVRANDLRLLLADLLGGAPLNATATRAADLTFDGQLDARDLYWLDRIIDRRDVSGLCTS